MKKIYIIKKPVYNAEYRREQYIKHREKILQKQKEYYDQHREEINRIIAYIYSTAQQTRCRILPAEVAAFRWCKKAAQQQKGISPAR